MATHEKNAILLSNIPLKFKQQFHLLDGYASQIHGECPWLFHRDRLHPNFFLFCGLKDGKISFTRSVNRYTGNVKYELLIS